MGVEQTRPCSPKAFLRLVLPLGFFGECMKGDVGGEVVDAYCIVQRDILVMCPALREWVGAWG
jgi:hypothetical protein